jgi:glycosyltransferase involved in cell wall biosynthesis
MSRLRPARKWILTCHGPDVIRGHSQAGSERDRYNIDPLLAASVNAAKRVIAISSIAGKSLIDIGVRSDKIAFISNGVDVKAFEKRIEFDWHKHLGIDPINKIVLTVARNYPEKNLSYGVRAFAKLARENRNIHYVVIGRGSAGLSSVVSEEGIAGRVSLLDPEIGDRLTSLFQHATVFFLPSLWECCPLVILEAMAAGLPQVATDVAGTNEFVENGKTGFLVGETNMDEAGECLRRVLFDQELRANMASSCKKEALRYDWAEIGRKYLETAAG